MRRPDSDAKVMLVRGDTELAVWSLPGGGQAELAVVDELARLQLAARRRGCVIRLRNASAELVRLIDLVGLGEIVPSVGVLGVEVSREAEGGEELGVEEVVVSDDPVA